MELSLVTELVDFAGVAPDASDAKVFELDSDDIGSFWELELEEGGEEMSSDDVVKDVVSDVTLEDEDFVEVSGTSDPLWGSLEGSSSTNSYSPSSSVELLIGVVRSDPEDSEDVDVSPELSSEGSFDVDSEEDISELASELCTEDGDISRLDPEVDSDVSREVDFDGSSNVTVDIISPDVSEVDSTVVSDVEEEIESSGLDGLVETSAEVGVFAELMAEVASELDISDVTLDFSELNVEVSVDVVKLSELVSDFVEDSKLSPKFFGALLSDVEESAKPFSDVIAELNCELSSEVICVSTDDVVIRELSVVSEASAENVVSDVIEEIRSELDTEIASVVNSEVSDSASSKVTVDINSPGVSEVSMVSEFDSEKVSTSVSGVEVPDTSGVEMNPDDFSDIASEEF